ncbi:hypothetical protein BT93_D0363 [Corymbia citriodora subsp. variegata]|nr:hypothetical protein BT93_D0363 [Corymbia citriodora subsp. variegata]
MRIHDRARHIWLRSSTMPCTIPRIDNLENLFGAKPQPEFLNEAAQQIHGKQQEQHEQPEDRAGGVVEQQPCEMETMDIRSMAS